MGRWRPCPTQPFTARQVRPDGSDWFHPAAGRNQSFPLTAAQRVKSISHHASGLSGCLPPGGLGVPAQASQTPPAPDQGFEKSEPVRFYDWAPSSSVACVIEKPSCAILSQQWEKSSVCGLQLGTGSSCSLLAAVFGLLFRLTSNRAGREK